MLKVISCYLFVVVRAGRAWDELPEAKAGWPRVATNVCASEVATILIPVG